MSDPSDVVELDIDRPAHGGWAVGRSDGMVVFVRGAIPAERVRARVTERRSRFWRAECLEVLIASPDRVENPWVDARGGATSGGTEGGGGVGGAELAHMTLPAQRAWKTAVIREQLMHLADLPWEGTVEAAPGDDETGGWGYRTRIALDIDAAGRPAMHVRRSRELRPVSSLPLATAGIQALDLPSRRLRPGARLLVAAPACGSPLGAALDGEPVSLAGSGRRSRVREQVHTAYGDFSYQVAVTGFWQVHRAAPQTLITAVLDALGPLDGARVADLYAGAGLFSTPLAQAVGESGAVVAVEADPVGHAAARRNAHGLPQLGLIEATVLSAATELGALDAMVLDPPRDGAGPDVMAAITASGARRVVYVACDPASLGRDLGLARRHGFEIEYVRGFDLFPQTHHVECVALLTRA